MVHRVLATVLICSLSCGCSVFGLGRTKGPTNFSSINEYLKYRNLGGPKPAITPLAIEAYEPEHDPAVRRTKRDEIVGALLAIDDYDFQLYAANAAYYQRGAATLGDFAVLGLTSAATITAGTQAKTVLSGVAAAITGGRIAVDKEIFYDTTLPLLLDRMRALRAAKRVEIIQKLASQNDAQYGLQMALTDVYDYFGAGTLAAALADISKDTVKKATLSTADELGTVVKGISGTVASNGVDYDVSNATWADATSTVTVTLKPHQKVGASPPPLNVDDPKIPPAIRQLLNPTLMKLSPAAQNAWLNAKVAVVDGTK